MARKQTEPAKPSFAASLDAKVRRQRYAEKTLNVRTFSLLARRPQRGAGFRQSARLQHGRALWD
jgi:hypothetical protein